MEFLMRDDVNLSAEQWQSIDSAVIQGEPEAAGFQL